MNTCFGIIGGDRRQAELAGLLETDGNTVYTYGLEPWRPGGSLELASSAEAVILPLPLCRGDGLLNCQEAVTAVELFRYLRPGQRVLAGQVQPRQQQEAASFGLTLEDYFLREELMVANAAATAEAAVQVAMERLDRTLLGMDCLVLGFGRIGKLLSHRLHGLGAKVTAAARKPEDRAWIRAYGLRSLDIAHLDGTLSDFGAVFNTVPAPVLNGPLLAQLPKDCFCVELASIQGIDLTAAERLGLPCVWARSLPGRMVPCTAAEAIRDAVYHILLEERGDPA
ncbi:dipicolinate synthase subunit DpsA [uncultured Dysosmobacter sp.]|uniref:dipicolinate synthase subunit DpsA n=1 Tax=uncultured Dysosmobacter sp. TaxID=2591384 RepID=UPI00261066FA|nr:dipicolinate synthase subunit DpsA [uncultured Dysosmobacter sp.]